MTYFSYNFLAIARRMRQIMRGTHLSTIAAALLFTTVAIFLVFNAHLHRLKSPHLLEYYSYSAPVVPEYDDDQPPSPTVIVPQFSILIGILTRADKYDHRHFLRMVYGIQSSSSSSYSKVVAHIDVKFVFCNLTKPEQRVLVALEIVRFDDVIILNCTENMNRGKTYTYFSSLPGILRRRRYDYVMKADDDVFIRLAPLAQSLRPLPRRDLYYGFVIPCGSTNPFVEYMSGMGFVLSWDLVEWISVSDIPGNDTFGPEDKLVGKWLNMGKRAKNRFSVKPAMYDYPGTNGRCSHDLIPETVAVHRLKRWDQWSVVLHFFNVTPAPTLLEKKNLVL